MNACVIDSSVWIELFAMGSLLQPCTAILREFETIYVPTLVIFEVCRKIARSVDEDIALSAVAFLRTNHVVELSAEIALLAADLSRQYRLATADSIVFAHAEALGSPLVTLDFDFPKIASVINLRAR